MYLINAHGLIQEFNIVHSLCDLILPGTIHWQNQRPPSTSWLWWGLVSQLPEIILQKALFFQPSSTFIIFVYLAVSQMRPVLSHSQLIGMELSLIKETVTQQSCIKTKTVAAVVAILSNRSSAELHQNKNNHGIWYLKANMTQKCWIRTKQ